MTDSGGAPATIIISAQPRYGFGSGLFSLLTPRASVNGRDVPLVWRRTTPVSVPPGRYEVSVWSRWLFQPEMGRSAAVAELGPGAAVHVVWEPPFIAFLRGSIRTIPVDLRERRDGGPDAAWLGDPTGRHHFRWWDGCRWTDRVNDAGVSSHDPV